MPNLVYTTGLPNPPNSPSQDVTAMQVNTNSINTWVQQDHFGFNTADNTGGYHDQVSLKDQAAPGIPAGLNGVLFSNANTGRSWPFWQNALGNFQITGSAAATAPSATQNGVSFLPGGLIFQWGRLAPVANGANNINLATAPNVVFPNNIFWANATLETTTFNALATNVYVGNLALNQISLWVVGGTIANVTGIYWTAIGR